MIEDNNMKKAFGKNLSDILYERKISQKQLGEHMKVSSATTSDWCAGKKMPRIDKLTRIARFLGVQMTDLVEEHQEGFFNPFYIDDSTAELAHKIYIDKKKLELMRAVVDCSDEETLLLLNITTLSGEDKAEIRGEVKQMMKNMKKDELLDA